MRAVPRRRRARRRRARARRAPARAAGRDRRDEPEQDDQQDGPAEPAAAQREAAQRRLAAFAWISAPGISARPGRRRVDVLERGRRGADHDDLAREADAGTLPVVDARERVGGHRPRRPGAVDPRRPAFESDSACARGALAHRRRRSPSDARSGTGDGGGRLRGRRGGACCPTRAPTASTTRRRRRCSRGRPRRLGRGEHDVARPPWSASISDFRRRSRVASARVNWTSSRSPSGAPGDPVDHPGRASQRG